MSDERTKYEYGREYRFKNAEKIRQQKKAYRARPEIRERDRLRWLNNSKHRQWDYVRERVKKGRLKRGPCIYCGKPDGHAHHEDYSKPLHIVWVCQFHHSQIHLGRLTVKPKDISYVGR